MMECFVRPLLRKVQADIPEPEALAALSKDEGGEGNGKGGVYKNVISTSPCALLPILC